MFRDVYIKRKVQKHIWKRHIPCLAEWFPLERRKGKVKCGLTPKIKAQYYVLS